MAKKRIKERTPKQGQVVKSQEPLNYDSHPPIFSLEKLQPGKYCLSSLNKDHKAMFSDAIFKRKSISWNEIKRSDRHALGTEKIPKSSIKAAIPPFITEDLDSFMVFRYKGKNPMVGYRQRDVFFVLWFDHDFTLYNH